jgi:anti-anti-sigma factor
MEHLTLKARKSPFNKTFVTVDLGGVLDINTAEDFETALADLFKEGQYHIILNMEKLSYISSTGFGKLFKIIEIIRKNRGDLKVTHTSPEIHKTLELLDIPSLLRGLKTRKKMVREF